METDGQISTENYQLNMQMLQIITKILLTNTADHEDIQSKRCEYKQGIY
jgi:hypothetical protein